MKKALIAMSGGVDSSVAAYLTQQAGYDCAGVTMRLLMNEDVGDFEESACCSLDDIADARSVAFRLGMPYYVFQFGEAFREKVIEPFVQAYEKGLTPNPCIRCNHYLKFDLLLQRARTLHYDCLVTGHYARIEQDNGKFVLKKAVDIAKDQSYVLYSLNQEQLARLRFPLGEQTKEETRALARTLGLVNAEKHDSQDICFVPEGNYAQMIERYRGKVYPPGQILDEKGEVVGQHQGVIHYTIGQRKGLGIAAKQALYVNQILPEENILRVGTEASLYARELQAGAFHWISGVVPANPLYVKAKIRYHAPEKEAWVYPTGLDTVQVVFDEPQRAITCGQAVVLYAEDTVLGGGVIQKVKKE